MERKIHAYKNYFIDFINSLSDIESKKVFYVLDMLKMQERLSTRFVKHIEDGIFELRAEHCGNIFRVFFIFDEGNVDVTNDYLSGKKIQWTCTISDNEELNSILSENITWKETTNVNQIMIKFSTNRSYIGETLTIVASIADETKATLQLNITS